MFCLHLKLSNSFLHAVNILNYIVNNKIFFFLTFLKQYQETNTFHV